MLLFNPCKFQTLCIYFIVLILETSLIKILTKINTFIINNISLSFDIKFEYNDIYFNIYNKRVYFFKEYV